MIRPLTPFDLIGFLFLPQSEKTGRAVTIDSLLTERNPNFTILGLSKSSIPIRGKTCAWLSAEGRSPNGFVVAKQMSGSHSWIVSHLVLKERADEFLSELLERVAQSAGSNGAQKVFIRMPRGDKLVDIARRSGFFPHVPEVLFVRDSQLSDMKPLDQPLIDSDFTLEPRTRSDDHGLFRLYNATTPTEVRYAVGMTIDQWLSSHEKVSGHFDEFVLKHRANISGWIGMGRQSRNGHIAAMVHPDHEDLLPFAVNTALKRMEGATRIISLVPEYQTALQTVLVDNGFRALSDYILSIKMMTITEKEETRVRVAAPTGL